MKILLEYEDGEGMDKPEMMRKPTAFHKKVAKMLAQQKGKKAPDEMDLKKAMELDEDEED